MLNRLPRVLVLLVAVGVLAGCSQNLGPKTYTNEVKDNYQENCIKGATDRLSAAEAATYCECTYTAFVDKVSFDRFKDFESYLRDHVGDDINSVDDLDETQYTDIVDLLEGCVSQGPSLSGSSASTTVPTTTTAG